MPKCRELKFLTKNKTKQNILLFLNLHNSHSSGGSPEAHFPASGCQLPHPPALTSLLIASEMTFDSKWANPGSLPGILNWIYGSTENRKTEMLCDHVCPFMQRDGKSQFTERGGDAQNEVKIREFAAPENEQADYLLSGSKSSLRLRVRCIPGLADTSVPL